MAKLTHRLNDPLVPFKPILPARARRRRAESGRLLGLDMDDVEAITERGLRQLTG
ncbi:hypothetical protein ACQUKI_20260 [Ralstonia pseudosolanacearum]